MNEITKERFEAHLEEITEKFFKALLDAKTAPGLSSEFQQSSQMLITTIQPLIRTAIKTGYVEAIKFLTSPSKDSA